ncbi:MAG: DUF4198 domain-containing protein [Acidobacteriia bacterium]|nr:DUF4198 domain-containing protein [Terriglobia bacterium]MYG01843.1 DUF4198 domain-containing protein [Terriglobia bacterium]MYK10174.1 DUF4198 domain-containing protein [Terriglobia bacterium]
MSGRIAQIAALCLLLPAGSSAHGLTAELVPSQGAVSVKCSYTNGDPAEAEVLVRSPSDANSYFAILRTDPSGVAHFEPDVAGRWRLTVDDGLGHRASLEFSVDGEGVARSVESGARSLVRYALLALTCAGLLAWWLLLRRRVSA